MDPAPRLCREEVFLKRVVQAIVMECAFGILRRTEGLCERLVRLGLPGLSTDLFRDSERLSEGGQRVTGAPHVRERTPDCDQAGRLSLPVPSLASELERLAVQCQRILVVTSTSSALA